MTTTAAATEAKIYFCCLHLVVDLNVNTCIICTLTHSFHSGGLFFEYKLRFSKCGNVLKMPHSYLALHPRPDILNKI